MISVSCVLDFPHKVTCNVELYQFMEKHWEEANGSWKKHAKNNLSYYSFAKF